MSIQLITADDVLYMKDGRPDVIYSLKTPPYGIYVWVGNRLRKLIDESTPAVPITISGGLTVGAKLTATIAAGWQSGGGVWQRDGADIAGATTLEYTTVAAGAHTWKDSKIPYTPPPVTVSAAPVVPSVSVAPVLQPIAIGGQLTFSAGTFVGTPTYKVMRGATVVAASVSSGDAVPPGLAPDDQVFVRLVASSAGQTPAQADSNTVVVAAPYPTLANSDYIIAGDSRVMSSSDEAPIQEPRRTGPSGIVAWLDAELEGSGRCIGNFGQNTDTVHGNLWRRSNPPQVGTNGAVPAGMPTVAPNNAAPVDPAAVDPTWRAYFGTKSPAKDAATSIFLIGVNNQTASISVVGPIYDALFGAEIEGGRQLVISANELPTSGANVAANLARRSYLEGWPYTSTGLTDAQKAAYAPKYRCALTWDALADSPGSGSFKTGWSDGGLHPIARGQRVLAKQFADVFRPILAANGFVRRSLVTTKATASATGVIFDDWTTAIAAGTALQAAVLSGETTAGTTNLDGQGGVCLPSGMFMPPNMSIVRGTPLKALMNGTQGNVGTSMKMETAVITKSSGAKALQTRIYGKLGATPGTNYTVQVKREAFLTLPQIQALGFGPSSAILAQGRVAFSANPQAIAAASMTATFNAPAGVTVPPTVYAMGNGATTMNPFGDMEALDRILRSPPSKGDATYTTVSGTYSFTVMSEILIKSGMDFDVTFEHEGLNLERIS